MWGVIEVLVVRERSLPWLLDNQLIKSLLKLSFFFLEDRFHLSFVLFALPGFLTDAVCNKLVKRICWDALFALVLLLVAS